MRSGFFTALAVLCLLRSAGQPALAVPPGTGVQADLSIYVPVVMNDYPHGLLNGDFESGRGVGWTEYSTHGWELVLNAGFPGNVVPHSGSWLAWLGGDYDDTSRISQDSITMAGSGTLHYWYWISSNDTCGHDFAYVRVNGTTLSTFQLCSSNNTGGWVEGILNLNSYANQTILLEFEETADANYNSNFFLDDVSIVP